MFSLTKPRPFKGQSILRMSEAQPGGPPECTCERLRGEMRLSWRDCAGSPLAAVLGCGGCEQIIPSSAERSKHQTHGGEWITPTGRDSGTLPGGVWVEGLGVCGPDKRPGKGARLQERIRQWWRWRPVLRS